MWEEANTGAYGSGFFEGILRLCWALLSEAIITRKERDGRNLPDMVGGQVSVEVRSCPHQFPILACTFGLDAPPLSTLGIQEKYLAPPDQSVEQEAMQL